MATPHPQIEPDRECEHFDVQTDRSPVLQSMVAGVAGGRQAWGRTSLEAEGEPCWVPQGSPRLCLGTIHRVGE